MIIDEPLKSPVFSFGTEDGLSCSPNQSTKCTKVDYVLGLIKKYKKDEEYSFECLQRP
jgi:hypothetical protein